VFSKENYTLNLLSREISAIDYKNGSIFKCMSANCRNVKLSEIIPLLFDSISYYILDEASGGVDCSKI
jgi:hypothetical protein